MDRLKRHLRAESKDSAPSVLFKQSIVRRSAQMTSLWEFDDILNKMNPLPGLKSGLAQLVTAWHGLAGASSILPAIHWTAILPRCYRSFGVRSRQRPPLNFLPIAPEAFDGNHPC